MSVLYLQRDETFFCDEHAPLCVTKTLGVPYLPQGAELPVDDNGDPLRLLFQLNSSIGHLLSSVSKHPRL